MLDTADGVADGYSSRVQQPARVEAVPSSHHLLSEQGASATTSAVPTVRDEEAPEVTPTTDTNEPGSRQT